MKRLAIACLAASGCLLLGSGCARHVVVEREGGRIDGARSLSVYSDTQWTVQRAPAPAAGAPGASGEAKAATPR